MNRDNKHIEEQIVKYLKGTITKQECDNLLLWVQESVEHQRMFDKTREIWLALQLKEADKEYDQLSAFERFRKKVDEKNIQLPTKEAIWKRMVSLSYSGAAAVVLIAVLSGMLLTTGLTKLFSPAVAESRQEIIVPFGSRSTVMLPDGSEVTLNAGSKLTYETGFGKNRRDLWLDGEGYFIVNKAETPFIVHSGEVQIKALGTEFNVRAYSSEDKIETTLVEGKVSINKIDERRQQVGDLVTLLPNQKLIVAREEAPDKRKITGTDADDQNAVAQTYTKPLPGRMLKQENVNPLPDISWKDKEWFIYRESLADLSVKMERRYDVSIHFQDEHLKSFRYNGTLPDESLEQVLRVMAIVSPIAYEVDGKRVTIYENKQFDKNKRVN